MRGKCIVFLLQRNFLDFHLLNLTAQLIKLCRHRVHLGLYESAGFINKVDCLVRQEPVADIPVRQNSGRHQRRIHDLDAVISLVSVLESAENRNRILYRRFIDHNRLETAFQRRILFNIFAVFVQRGRANAVQFAACQHRLQHVAGIHRTLGLAGTDDRMQLIDKEQDLAVRLLDFIEDGFQPFLKLAAVLGTRNQRAHIQRENLLVFQRCGYIPLGDSLRETFDYRRLADAGLTDQHRVVLGLSRENPDDISDFIITADHRINLLRLRLRDKLLAEFLQRIISIFRIVRCDLLAAADSLQRLQKSVLCNVKILENL